MERDLIIPLLVYLTAIRLAIVAAGIVSVVLGYRLFCRGVWPDNQASFDATFAGQSFSLKNAAPGTCFALFGMITIVASFAANPPGVDVSKDGAHLRGQTPASPAASNEQELHQWLTEAAHAFRQPGGDFRRADELYEKVRASLEIPIDQVALLYNELAYRYLREEKNEDASRHAHVAILLRPDDADYVDTYAVSVCRTEGPQAAVDYLTSAPQSGDGALRELRESLVRGTCPAR